MKTTNKKREYLEIKTIIEQEEYTTTKSFAGMYNLYAELKKNNQITKENCDELLSLIEQKVGSDWCPFMMKVYLENNRSENPISVMTVSYIRFYCLNRLLQCGFEKEELDVSMQDFFTTNSRNNQVQQFLSKLNQNKQTKASSIEMDDSIALGDKDKAIIAYLWYVIHIRNKKSLPMEKQLLEVEKAFSTYYSEIDVRKRRSYICTVLPQLLLKASYKRDLGKLLYLYYGTDEAILESEAQIENLKHANERIIDENAKKSDQIQQLKTKISEIDNLACELRVRIEALDQEKVAAENRLKFEKNKYEKQYKTLAIGLSDRLENDIGLEILGIEDVISDITDRERAMIKRRINNIKAIISELGDK